jgi:hypothetical protein
MSESEREAERQRAALRIQSQARRRAASKRVKQLQIKRTEAEHRVALTEQAIVAAQELENEAIVEALKCSSAVKAPVSAKGAVGDSEGDQELAALRIQAQARRVAASKRVKELQAQRAEAQYHVALAEQEISEAKEMEAVAAAEVLAVDADAPPAAHQSRGGARADEETQAALRIQSQARRVAASKRVKELQAQRLVALRDVAETEHAVLVTEAEFAAASAGAAALSDASASGLSEEDAAALRIQSQARRRAAAKRVKELQAARAEALGRLVAVEEELSGSGAAAPAQRRASQPAAGFADDSELAAAREAAALRIQSQARRVAASKRVKELQAQREDAHRRVVLAEQAVVAVEEGTEVDIAMSLSPTILATQDDVDTGSSRVDDNASDDGDAVSKERAALRIQSQARRVAASKRVKELQTQRAEALHRIAVTEYAIFSADDSVGVHVARTEPTTDAEVAAVRIQAQARRRAAERRVRKLKAQRAEAQRVVDATNYMLETLESARSDDSHTIPFHQPVSDVGEHKGPLLPMLLRLTAPQQSPWKRPVVVETIVVAEGVCGHRA